MNVQTFTYPNGQKQWDVTYKAGRNTGVETWWSDSGRKQWERTWTQNRRTKMTGSYYLMMLHRPAEPSGRNFTLSYNADTGVILAMAATTRWSSPALPGTICRGPGKASAAFDRSAASRPTGLVGIRRWISGSRRAPHGSGWFRW